MIFEVYVVRKILIVSNGYKIEAAVHPAMVPENTLFKAEVGNSDLSLFLTKKLIF